MINGGQSAHKSCTILIYLVVKVRSIKLRKHHKSWVTTHGVVTSPKLGTSPKLKPKIKTLPSRRADLEIPVDQVSLVTPKSRNGDLS